MRTMVEVGAALSQRRKELGLKQYEVARTAGLRPEALTRLEKGQLTEFGVRKLLAVLAVLGMELTFTQVGRRGTLDQLLRERGGDL